MAKCEIGTVDGSGYYKYDNQLTWELFDSGDAFIVIISGYTDERKEVAMKFEKTESEVKSIEIIGDIIESNKQNGRRLQEKHRFNSEGAVNNIGYAEIHGNESDNSILNFTFKISCDGKNYTLKHSESMPYIRRSRTSINSKYILYPFAAVGDVLLLPVYGIIYLITPKWN